MSATSFVPGTPGIYQANVCLDNLPAHPPLYQQYPFIFMFWEGKFGLDEESESGPKYNVGV